MKTFYSGQTGRNGKGKKCFIDPQEPTFEINILVKDSHCIIIPICVTLLIYQVHPQLIFKENIHKNES